MPPASGEPNPYAAPTADVSGSAALGTHELSAEEVMLYVGPRFAWYWRRWEQALHRQTFAAGFNWPALLVTIPWLFYRKLFREAVVVSAAFVGLGAIQGVLALTLTADLHTIDRALDIGAAVAMGFLGNGLYLRRARLVIADARLREPDAKRRAQLLMRKGGTSNLWAVVGVLLVLGTRFAAGFLGH